MLPDLPENYYLDNVHTLFDHLRRVYADILEPGTLQFLDRFDALSADAQRLCIRLLNRAPDYYRRGKLAYAEIASIDAAIDELSRQEFIAVNPDIEREDLLALYTLGELRALLAEFPGLADCTRLKRADLVATLADDADDAFFERLAQQDDWLLLLRREEYLLCQMLFFGNLNQSMTDFVLSDLGLQQYEGYRVDPEHRPYRDTLEIRQHWLLYQLQALYEQADHASADELEEIASLIPADIAPHAPAWRKSEQLRFEIARQLERIGDLERARVHYRRCLLPPSRERRARIRDQLGQPGEAIALCRDIIDEPFDEQELQFACQFALRLGKRHDLDAPAAAARLHIEHRPPLVDLELDYHESVEQAVAEHYTAAGDTCRYVENSLFNGVLGLMIWDSVFAPLPGAFYNPFQYRPSDFYAHDFCRRREALLRETWASIDSNDDIWRIVNQRWQEKHGVMNPLVNWAALDLELVGLALERIEHAHWRAVFTRILRDLRNHRSGFPDLVHFPAAGGYCLVEVKGPGDSLQKNQQRWMQFFADHGIPHRLARVSWCQP